MNERRAQIQQTHALAKTRRCELLAVARSTAYYQPEAVSEEDWRLMRLIDELCSKVVAEGVEEAAYS